ncbi:histone H1-like [Eurosta solidaginis]|uniref:histone H1-like n=1 Tax=Eurosta solidaginis TaxID=178769 RepID=UPI0035308C47
MKFHLCKSFETSDDEEVEEVSEEEGQQEDSNEDENDEESAGSNEEDDAPEDSGEEEIDTEEEELAIPKSSEVKLNGKSSGETEIAFTTNGKSNGTESSDTDSAVRTTNGKLETDIVKKEESEPLTKFNGAKPLSNTKSNVTVSVPSRLKNVSTETMVIAAIRSLNERGGSSAIAIKKYIMNNYPQLQLEGARILMLIKKFVKKALLSGKLVQSKGVGLGGSFKVSAELNRMEEKKERAKLKQLKQKPKKDAAAAGKADKKTKSTTKAKTKKSDTKTTTSKKIAKTKTTTTATKLTNGSEVAANQKAPKASAALKKVPKPIDLKQPKKAVIKDLKSSLIDNGKSAGAQMPKQSKSTKSSSSVTFTTVAEKPKKGSPVKSISVATVSATPKKPAPKAKATPMPKNKPAAKFKPAVPDFDEINEIGAGDVDNVKPATKKAAGKKGKAK